MGKFVLLWVSLSCYRYLCFVVTLMGHRNCKGIAGKTGAVDCAFTIDH